MESSHSCESWRPPYPVRNHHHHHHLRHHHPVILCPLHHHHHHHHCHAVLCPLHRHHHHVIVCHSHRSPTLPLQNRLNSGSTTVENEGRHSGAMVLKEQEYEGVEEEEEPIFVLSDEWREFFAKSEAKRKLEKKQAKEKHKY